MAKWYFTPASLPITPSNPQITKIRIYESITSPTGDFGTYVLSVEQAYDHLNQQNYVEYNFSSDRWYRLAFVSIDSVEGPMSPPRWGGAQDPYYQKVEIFTKDCNNLVSENDIVEIVLKDYPAKYSGYVITSEQQQAKVVGGYASFLVLKSRQYSFKIQSSGIQLEVVITTDDLKNFNTYLT